MRCATWCNPHPDRWSRSLRDSLDGARAGDRAGLRALGTLRGVARERGTDGSLTEREIQLELRQMALVDRVLGLEAEVARLRANVPPGLSARDEIERLQAELRSIYGPRTRAIGATVVRVLRARRAARAK